MTSSRAGASLTEVPPDAVFRDPPPPEAPVAVLERELARVLVRAPTLPIDLPVFELTLRAITPTRDGVELVLGRRGDRLATVSLAWSEADGALTTGLRWEGPSRSARDRQGLPVLMQRLRAGITVERWADACKLREQILAVPRNLPVEAFRMLVPGSRVREGLVRTGFDCNQDCGLCWQGRDWGRVGPEQILAWIEDLHAAGAERLVISGGEPTLDRDLPRYLVRARELGFACTTLETNALRMAKDGYARTLRDSGLERAFVSLHSADASVSDAVTRAPGTHARTLVGIDALLEAGVSVALNAVMTSETVPTLGGLPDFVHERFGGHPLLEMLVISDIGAAFDDRLLPDLVPQPELARAALSLTIERALALGLEVNGPGSPCGPPLCMFGADERVVRLDAVAEPVPFREFARACDGCALKHACFGVRPIQLALFGERCVQPFVATGRRR